MKIGIDIDEGVTKYIESFLEFLKSEKNIFINYSEILNYHQVGASVKINNEQMHKFIYEHTNQEGVLLNLELCAGAFDSINFLDEIHEIFFVTFRHISNKDSPTKFFKKYFPNKDFKIIFSGDAWGGAKTKSEICKEKGIFLLIEDNLNYALECAFNGIQVILFDKPWNQEKDLPPNIFRVNGWKDALEKMKDMGVICVGDKDGRTKIF